MKCSLKNLSSHEKQVILNAVEEIIDREGPMYVRPLYETLRRDHEIDLFGENIKDLLNGDPRFALSGTYQELVTLKSKPEEKRIHITELLPSLEDYFKNTMGYSTNDIGFLCSKLKRAKFTEKTIIQDLIDAYDSVRVEAMKQYV